MGAIIYLAVGESGYGVASGLTGIVAALTGVLAAGMVLNCAIWVYEWIVGASFFSGEDLEEVEAGKWDSEAENGDSSRWEWNDEDGWSQPGDRDSLNEDGVFEATGDDIPY